MMSAENDTEEEPRNDNNSDADKENIPLTEDKETIPPAKKQKVVKTKINKTKNKEQKNKQSSKAEKGNSNIYIARRLT